MLVTVQITCSRHETFSSLFSKTVNTQGGEGIAGDD